MIENKLIRVSIIFFIWFFALHIYAVSDRNDSLRRVVSQLEQAIIEKDIEYFKENVSDQFSVSIATMPNAIRYANQVIETDNKIDSVRISSFDNIIYSNNKLFLPVLFYRQGNIANSQIVLDKQLRLVRIDYFDNLYGMNRDEPAKLKATIPFSFENNAIIIKLSINDSNRALRFLFDTGADGMAITREIADEIGLTTNRSHNASVVGANQKISISANNTIHIDSLTIPQQNIAIFDEIGSHDGIIGLNLAQMYIVRVDFDNQNILLYSLGKMEAEHAEVQIPIEVPYGVIQIASKLNLVGKEEIAGDFILDTGAGFHVVAFSPFVRKNRLLLSGFKYESTNSMLSMGHTTMVYHGKAELFSFGGLEFLDFPISLQASAGNDDWNPGVAGSIGIELLKRYNFTINLVDKKLGFTPVSMPK